MKTQIITLESHDDLISVRDRMSWAKTPRILLVWPKYEKVLLRQVDLKILQRHAAFLGAQLGLVTRTRHVRAEAESLRIPVFESTGQAQKVSWPAPRRRRWIQRAPRKDLREKRELVQVEEPAWRVNPLLRLGVFSVGVLSVLVLVALFIPRAQVRLTPISTTQSVVLLVIASLSVDSVFISGNIPAREKHVIVEGEQTVTVTGEGVVPQSKARGVVEFRNLTQQSVTIPAGTVIQAAQDAPVRFVTLEDSAVDAGVGKTAEVPVEAIEGGFAGNLPEDTLIVIEGRLGLSLSVTNPEPTTRGRERASVQASESDRARAKNLLMRSLDEMAREKLRDEIGGGDMLLDETLRVSQVLLEEYNPPAGAAGTRLSLTMQVEYSVMYAAASDLAELALLAMNASLPTGFRADSADAVTINPLSKPSIEENGTARWTMKVEREIIQTVDPTQVTYLIQGLSSASAQSRLQENIPLAASPIISLSPSWWPWVPIVPFRISVETE
ncbi:MAG TPA: baseplate J/gp47 family protein [Anaerolineales bacterium]|nr:baseplate J/gp47 family protein [Anaerolineales bacterium]